jgi:hypothetical protein
MEAPRMADASWVTGVVSAQEARVNDGGLLAKNTSALDVRTGVMFGPGSTAIVTGTAATGTMTVNVNVCHWVASRGTANGPYRGTKETSTTLNIGAAPGSNSRIDVVWAKMQDNTAGVPTPDGVVGEQYGVTAGTAAASPTKPAIPLGAVEIATVQIASGTTSTNGAGATITNSALQVVAAGAPIPVRNTTERNALTTYAGLHVVRLDNGGRIERWVTGTTWVTYDALQVPLRSRRVAATASGTLGSGVTVPIAAAAVLPAAPHGTGVPYRIRVSGQIRVDLPAGLGAHLTVTVGATSYEVDRFASSALTTYYLRGEEVFYIATDAAQTVTVSVTADAGTITITPTGGFFVETLPYTAL